MEVVLLFSVLKGLGEKWECWIGGLAAPVFKFPKVSGVYLCLDLSWSWLNFRWHVIIFPLQTRVKVAKAMIWMCPPKIHIKIPSPKGDGNSRWGLWEVLKSWKWSPHECLYKRGPGQLPSAYYYYVRIQGCDLEEGPRLTILAPWPQTSSLQNCKQ